MEIGQLLIDRSGKINEPGKRRAHRLAIIVWTEEFEMFLDEWLNWICSHSESTPMDGPESVRLSIRSAFREMGKPYEFNRWARQTWVAMKETNVRESKSDSTFWNWQQYDVWPHIGAGELEKAETIVRRAISFRPQ